MLSPALGFVLQEIWSYDNNHYRFWQAVSYLVNDKDGDPIIRSSAGRIAADYPTAQHDLLWLAERVAADDEKMITTLSHICGALAIRFEDEKEVVALPWVYLVAALTPWYIRSQKHYAFCCTRLSSELPINPYAICWGQPVALCFPTPLR